MSESDWREELITRLAKSEGIFASDARNTLDALEEEGWTIVPKATKAAIAHELYKALEHLEAPPELLSIIGSYGDTLSDEEVLRLLKEWNAGGKIMQERQ